MHGDQTDQTFEQIVRRRCGLHGWCSPLSTMPAQPVAGVRVRTRSPGALSGAVATDQGAHAERHPDGDPPRVQADAGPTAVSPTGDPADDVYLRRPGLRHDAQRSGQRSQAEQVRQQRHRAPGENATSDEMPARMAEGSSNGSTPSSSRVKHAQARRGGKLLR